MFRRTGHESLLHQQLNMIPVQLEAGSVPVKSHTRRGKRVRSYTRKDARVKKVKSVVKTAPQPKPRTWAKNYKKRFDRAVEQAMYDIRLRADPSMSEAHMLEIAQKRAVNQLLAKVTKWR